MKTSAFLVILLIGLFYSCKPDKKEKTELPEIQQIENNLLPKLIIEGEEHAIYNIHDRMNYHHVPGVSIAFIDEGKIKWAKGYGFTSYDSLVPVNENTLFQAASISKPLAALAALTFVEEGKIELDDNVNDYLKSWQVEENEFTMDEKVTLRRLLSHSAGLTVHGFRGYAEGDSVPGIIQILNGEPPANSGKILPNVRPGVKYRYSGGGYTIMQKMLEDVSGKPFPEILNERVLAKTGMTNSSFVQPLPMEKHKNAAAGHRSGGEKIEGNWHTYPEMAAAGLWTTPTDLLKYALEVQNSIVSKSNKVLSSEMTKEMLTVQADSHGLGPGLSDKGDLLRFSHGGANEGYRCYLMAFAKRGQGVAIMTNGDNGGYLYNEILRAFSKVYDWTIYKPHRKVLYPLAAGSLEEFAGKYKFTEDSLVMEFEVENDHLMGVQHWNKDTFRIFAESDLNFFNKDDGASFVFKKIDEGTIDEVLIQNQFKFSRMN